MNMAWMDAAVAGWMGDFPLLPSPAAMQWGLQASWSVVLAWLGAMLAARCMGRRGVPVVVAVIVTAGVAVALAASAWLPGQAASSYWLGLAFQAPSMSAVLLCAVLLRAQWARWWAGHANAPQGAAPVAGSGAVPAEFAGRDAPRVVRWCTPDAVLAVLGVLLGWALLLDTFALLPVELYAWGFRPMAAAVLLLLCLTPWLLLGWGRSGGLGTAVCAVAVMVFVLLRLPSGNVWDALLDPWLWLALHVHVARRLRFCY
ncbi:MAG: hypothetical protein IPH37_04115 [Burkholderiales bacterium]|nr:hypothetical protein [Burkholderiales bacterium]